MFIRVMCFFIELLGGTWKKKLNKESTCNWLLGIPKLIKKKNVKILVFHRHAECHFLMVFSKLEHKFAIFYRSYLVENRKNEAVEVPKRLSLYWLFTDTTTCIVVYCTRKTGMCGITCYPMCNIDLYHTGCSGTHACITWLFKKVVKSETWQWMSC